MASGGLPRHLLRRIAVIEVVAVVISVAVAVARPAREADAWVNARLLELVASRTPPESVIAIAVGGDLLRSGACASTLRSVVSAGNARTVVLLSSLDELCRLSPLAPGPPRVLLPITSVHRVPGGAIVGIDPDGLPAGARERLGIGDGLWVAARPWRSIPLVGLADMASGRIDPTVIAGRVAVVGLDGSLEVDESGHGPHLNRVAGMLAAAIEDRPRRDSTRTVLAGLAMITAVLGAIGHRYRRRRALSWAMRGALGVGLFTATAAGLWGYGWLVPVPSMMLCLTALVAVVSLPAWIARRRGTSEALRLLDSIEELGSEDIATLPDHVFWARLARRVAGAHAADNVLLAELPPFSWRLRVHANEDVSEVVIGERRRDVRRPPYTDVESGQRRIKVAMRYVVMKDVPTVLVPLESAGELEGYAFLIGKAAVDAFQHAPAATERLALEIAKIIRQRRLTRVRADDWRRPAGFLVADAGDRAFRIVEGSRAALGKLEQLGRVARSSPVGLLYADAFADVRMLGEPVAKWLARLSIKVPSTTEGRLLAPGALPLAMVLKALARETGDATVVPDELTDEGRVFELSMAEPGATGVDFVFTVRRLTDGDTPYYVGALVEIPRRGAIDKDNVHRIVEQRDPLTAFSLSKTLVGVVEVVTRRSDGRIRLQSPRMLAHVLGHPRELRDSLLVFLGEAAGQASAKSGPTLTLTEHSHRIELAILDVQLGVPPAAVKRTLLAPSMPPPGMTALGNLARAVENSHGTVTMKHEDGWGVEITLSFVRARPRVEAEPSAEVIELPKAPKVPKGSLTVE